MRMNLEAGSGLRQRRKNDESKFPSVVFAIHNERLKIFPMHGWTLLEDYTKARVLRMLL
uniref:Uncharacterized protein n=2 Tax=Picea TaxID=3328 RepID=A0A101LXU6_PICGL|nr:hypothetical protein ABT39_MTgene5512 [Picea glauca]QHR91578.1 hypothetical protein Q903MT_gene5613 [Picea sitchensis]